MLQTLLDDTRTSNVILKPETAGEAKGLRGFCYLQIYGTTIRTSRRDKEIR